MKTGGDLRYYLRKRYLFEERDVAFYVACISSALEHLHSRNVIHRDIKPGVPPFFSIKCFLLICDIYYRKHYLG